MFLVFVAKFEDLLSFLQFFWLSNWKNSELSRVLNMRPWQFNLYSVYFKGYFSWICTFVHFPEIFNFVQFSQHICQYAEFLSSYHAKEIKYQNLYAKIQIFLFMQNVCKHNVHSTIRGFSLLYNWPFLGLSEVWNRLFLHFSCLKLFFLYLIVLVIP